MNSTIEIVEERLKQILLAVMKDDVDANTIRTDAPLVNSGVSLDSVALLEFVIRIETEFSINVDDGVLTREHFESLGSLARAVQAEVERQTKS
jgi:acyl carrier protein